MTSDKARSLLTSAAIETTVRTIVALDFLQGVFYKDAVLPEMSKHIKITDSEEWELASGSLKAFVFQCPSGNNQGVRMNSSAFINGLRMLDLQDEATIAIQVCANIQHDEN